MPCSCLVFLGQPKSQLHVHFNKEQKLSQNNVHEKKICPRFYGPLKIVETTCLHTHIISKIFIHVQIGV